MQWPSQPAQRGRSHSRSVRARARQRPEPLQPDCLPSMAALPSLSMRPLLLPFFLPLLLPPLQVVPVYTRADSEDTLIRAYAKCSAYQAKLKKWFDSEEFKSKEAESAALRNEIGALTQGALDVSLKNWWNV